MLPWVLCVPAGSAVAVRPAITPVASATMALSPTPRRALARCALGPAGGAEGGAAKQTPAKLAGPWNVRSTLSGMEETWVELGVDGEVDTSARSGTGGSWHAEGTPARPSAPACAAACVRYSSARHRMRSGSAASGWRLRFTILDKLGRPFAFVGDVQSDEYTRVAVSGRVLGAPKGRAPSGQQQEQRGDGGAAEVAEFRAWPA